MELFELVVCEYQPRLSSTK